MVPVGGWKVGRAMAASVADIAMNVRQLCAVSTPSCCWSKYSRTQNIIVRTYVRTRPTSHAARPRPMAGPKRRGGAAAAPKRGRPGSTAHHAADAWLYDLQRKYGSALAVAAVVALALLLSRIFAGGRASTNQAFCPSGRVVSHTPGAWQSAAAPTAFVAVDSIGTATEAAPAIATLTVATYNAEWLFDGLDDAHREWHTADAHIARVGKALDSLGADIINVVELEDCAVLSRVAASMPGNSDGRFVYVPPSRDSATHQTVGLITRHRLASSGLQVAAARASYPVRDSSCGLLPSGRGQSTGLSKHWFGVFR